MTGLSALGRIQSREHWLSDTVVSAIMGYVIGTLVGTQSDKKEGANIELTSNSVKATWSFK